MLQLNNLYVRGVVLSFSKLKKSGIKLTKRVCDVPVTFWSISFSRLAVHHLRMNVATFKNFMIVLVICDDGKSPC
jgi:hypothetical protein